MYDQFVLEVISKSAKEIERAPSYYDFSSEELQLQKSPKRRIHSMLKIYNLIDSMEFGIVTFCI